MFVYVGSIIYSIIVGGLEEVGSVGVEIFIFFHEKGQFLGEFGFLRVYFGEEFVEQNYFPFGSESIMNRSSFRRH